MGKLRRAIGLLLVLAMMFGWVPLPMLEELGTVQAVETPTGPTEGNCGEGITWKLTEDTVPDWDLEQGKPYKLTIEGTGGIAFPDGEPPWKEYSPLITTLSISDGITSIGIFAFRGCASLKALTLPDSVETIGYYAFGDCYSLKTVVCGSGLKEIGGHAFLLGTALTDVQLNSGLEKIGDFAFSGCWHLEEVSIPDSVLSLGVSCFGRSGLVSLKIPKGVTEIGDAILLEAEYVTEIQVVPENTSFQAIDNVLYKNKDGKPYQALAFAHGAFQSGSALTIADGTEVVKSYTFKKARVSSVQFPSSLREIEQCAFTECNNIKEIQLPDGVEILGDEAFSFCGSLEAVEFGKNVQNMEYGAFYNSNKLAAITVAEGSQFLDAVENVLYNKEHTILCLYAPAKPEKVYQVLGTAEEIVYRGMVNASFLEELYMPEKISTLNHNSISGNKRLKSIYFPGDAPASVHSASISENGENLLIYRQPSSAGWDAEVWASFQLADWEQGNEVQEEGTFGNVSWKYEGDKGRISFAGTGEIPDFTEEGPAPWSGYMGNIQTVETAGVTGIGNYAFSGGGKLLRLETDSALKRIGDGAFSNCGALVFFELETAEEIGERAFENASSMKGRLTLEQASSIGSGAFSGCASLTTVTLGSRLAALREDVFSGCSAMSACIVPEPVAEIQSRAFQGCTSLRAINIPSAVHTIGPQAFAGDSALEKVYFYGTVPASFAEDSFLGCNGNLALCYRTSQPGWDGLGNVWNGIPLLGQEKFYTEREDHYSFNNSARSFGYPIGYRLPRQRYVDVLDSIVRGTYYYAINPEWEGSCYGMAGTTLEFYENPEQFSLAEYGSLAENLYQVPAPGRKDAPLTKLIEGYQISQYKTALAGCRGILSKTFGDYEGMVHKTEAFERSGGLRVDVEAEPLLVAVYSKYSAHAVIPVSVEQAENGDFLMKVYDCNKPFALQTLTVKKDFSGISYGIYYEAAYLGYSEVAAAMSGIELHGQETDTSLYLSVDKENGMVTDASGKTVDEIEDAYEQKPFRAGEEEEFSGIRSFVLPEGEYQIAAEPSGEQEEAVTYYLASEGNFAEITSTDEHASLAIQRQGEGSVELSLQPSSQQEEASSFVLVNQQGMERTVEVAGSAATVEVHGGSSFDIQVPEGVSVSIDGKAVNVQGGAATGTFAVSAGENPFAIKRAETELTCNAQKKLSGTAGAEVVFNNSNAQTAKATVSYYDKAGKEVAAYSEDMQLTPGLNNISLSFAGLAAKWEGTSGSMVLSCKIAVADGQGNFASSTIEGIVVSPDGKPGTGITEPDRPSSGDSGDTKPGDNGGTTGNNGGTKPGINGGTTGDSGSTKPETNGGTSGGSGSTKPGTSKPSVSSKAMVKKLMPGVKRITLGQGEAYQLKVAISPRNAVNRRLSYRSSNKRVKVTSTGKITARKTGTAKVTVASSNGKKASVTVTVKKAPKKITLNRTEKALKKGQKFQIKVKFPKGAASHKLTYQSSKKSVAAVSKSGKVTAKKKGAAVITIKTFNGKKAKLKVYVK